ncbi:MAG: BlaI/MecI/CopY family transcriptional regulator, partial [Gammaproteobacteria bacterium]|nr:BlaI/MecI/CopY family transcriptional regulator [Gammaproteobacteria bacterium]
MLIFQQPSPMVSRVPVHSGTDSSIGPPARRGQPPEPVSGEPAVPHQRKPPSRSTRQVSELPPLSRRERQVMDILYESGGATAVQIRARMADPPTDSAVRAILRILINKRHLTRELDGPRYVYAPTTPVPRASRSAMRHVLSTFFGGSVEGAVATLLKLR